MGNVVDAGSVVDTRPSVLLVDDNELVAGALERWLTVCGSMRRFRWADSLGLAEALIKSERPDVVLMELEVAGRNAFELVPRLAGQSPRVRVIMLSSRIDKRSVERAMDAGAAGFLGKDATPR